MPSTHVDMSTVKKRKVQNAHSPQPSRPFEPPTVGTKVHPNGHQVQRAMCEHLLSSAKKQLFDVMPDS